MAKQVTLIDDLDGVSEAAEVTFEYAGKIYEIDLSADHWDALFGALQTVEKAIAAARPVPHQSAYGALSTANRRAVRSFLKRAPGKRISDKEVADWQKAVESAAAKA